MGVIQMTQAEALEVSNFIFEYLSDYAPFDDDTNGAFEDLLRELAEKLGNAESIEVTL
jgi:hypothetical protein